MGGHITKWVQSIEDKETEYDFLKDQIGMGIVPSKIKNKKYSIK